MTDQHPDQPAHPGAVPPVPPPSVISRRSLLRTGAVVGAGASALTIAGAASAAPEHDTALAEVVLADAGQTGYRVYLGAGESPIVRHAANELATYLHTITGATFPVTVSDQPPTGARLLVVGRKNPLAGPLAIDYAKLSDDGFALRTFQPSGGLTDSILVTGASDRGTLYGVYWFLDRLCGVRWFSPDYTVTPTRTRLAVQSADVNRDSVPKFRFREVFASDGFEPRYRQHNLLNGSSHHIRDAPVPAEVDTWSGYWPYETHNFHELVPDQSLWTGGQLKAMDPATRHLAAWNLVDRIRRKVAAGGDASFGFGQMDWGWTPDAASKAFADAHGGVLSAPIIDMVNNVASRVKVEISNARVSTLAYQFSYDAPTGMHVDDNVVLTIAPIHADFAHPLISSPNGDVGPHIETWAGLTDEIVVWTYNTNFHHYLLPFPNYRAMCESVKQLGARNVQGYFGQAAWDMGGGAELAHLRMWVLARLLWDPTLDPDALMREFADGFYGAGGTYVWQYMQVMMAALAASGMRMSAFIGTHLMPFLDFATARTADGLLNSAEQAVQGNPAHLRHVQIARIGLDLVILLRRNSFAQEAARRGITWNLDIDRRIARFNAAVVASGMTRYREGMGAGGSGDLAWLRSYVSLKPRAATTPHAVGPLPVTGWVDFQEHDMTLYAPATTIVADANASDGYCVRMPGNTADWGFQLNLGLLPEDGSWKLFAVVRADTGSAAADATAMVMGVHPGSTVNIPVRALSDGAYHVVPMPGTYQRNSGLTLWMSPPNSAAIPNVYIDRFYAIKVRAATPPDAVVGLPASSWADFQEYDMTLHPPVTTVVADANASDGYCVRMPGNKPDWGFQLNLGLLPATGSWRLYAVVRADTGSAAPTATAMVMGVYPPFGNVTTIPVSTVADGAYHVVAMPGTYQRNAGLTLWISPRNSAAVAHVAIDRFYAVKA